ncbi:hypothetical protein QE152_g26325 [Popillia japonica]|uniref:RNase H type-1 domain-containing protein n=1 Tax=Popillia japonica TaxID=7064 RepID=A0AAW1JYS8_POPJA
MGAMRSTQVVALHTEPCVLPISDRMQFLTDNFVVKHYCAHIDPIRGVLQEWSGMLRLYPNWNSGQISAVIKSYRRVRRCNIWFTKDTREASLSILIARCTAIPGEAGNGVFRLQLNIAEAGGLCEFRSVYHAEYYAILRAIVIGRKKQVASVIILPDSQAAIKKRLQRGCTPTGSEDKELILDYNRAGRIVVLWVPEYCGILGNEAAVNLAVEGARGEVRRREIYPRDLKSIRRLAVEQEWEQEFQNSEKGFRYKAALSGQMTKPWFAKIRFDGRKFTTTICRLRFYHNHLNGHLYRLKMVE